MTAISGRRQGKLELEVLPHTYEIDYRLYGDFMKTNLKGKNYYLDENKIRRVRTILV